MTCFQVCVTLLDRHTNDELGQAFRNAQFQEFGHKTKVTFKSDAGEAGVRVIGIPFDAMFALAEGGKGVLDLTQAGIKNIEKTYDPALGGFSRQAVDYTHRSNTKFGVSAPLSRRNSSVF